MHAIPKIWDMDFRFSLNDKQILLRDFICISFVSCCLTLCVIEEYSQQILATGREISIVGSIRMSDVLCIDMYNTVNP